ncbi:MAG: hypothetical protein HY718_00075, partial [Planctomycetes bacterium]|nr:hypothetical protein [Planctomycetota bacterium]
PASLTRTVRAGLNAASQTFTVANSGSGTLNYTIESDVTWASINPTEGSSTGQTDTITVNYATSLLNIGTHTGTVTITALGATNSPQTVGLTMIVEAVPGDLDQDGDIDVNDATLFGTCLGGADVPISEPACASADLDGDGDADLSDYGLMQKCTSGPAVKAEPHCVN